MTDVATAQGALQAIQAVLLIGALLAALRVARGPTLADRVIAFDVVAILALAVVLVEAVRTDEPAYIDAAIVLSLLVFLATVALARFLERRGPILRGWR
jgi:multicomponent Na+:H+ antiporter subunit F